ncbi:N-acetylneuraminate lyase [Anseongella ginsenosidimutans]|uniref:N-acetylneuraminate lyase n=1 Tax=Anseongella ginsenosidimutans TaxID=496056 RepID=A0A4R3KP40_9SPHI|nr:dihydrodipicolinate synthase family protein [Anseongella ginsenosidimutans]QEC52401.1 N-acetylneuraminate lyase [Anseongella ginsenosidimutans]TCS85856.1 N-acetylneuraminate lyase [Anseongella ginsenosidimutans]
MTKKISGLLAAPFTPMHPDGAINTSKIPAMVDLLVNNGITGIFICGSTGEGPSLTVSERKELAEAFVDAAGKRLKVFVHVGHNSLADARDLAAHAQQTGADFISATPPAYFKISSTDMLVQSLAMIASGAPELPLYYYHIPSLTGVGLDMVDFLEQAGQAIPTLAGIKYTAPFVYEFQSCMNYAGKKYDVLYGSDEMLLSALATGSKGFIGSTYNFIAPLYRELINSFNSGKLEAAQALQLTSVDIVRVINKYGGLRAQKTMMKLIGMDCGPVRLPLRPMDAQETMEMEKDLQQATFFDWASKLDAQPH